jgi:hypothetical protein
LAFRQASDTSHARLAGDLRCLAGPWAVIERGHHAKPPGASQAPLNGLVGHADRLANRIGRRIRAIGKQDAGALHAARRFTPRPRRRFKPCEIILANCNLNHPPRCRHDRLALLSPADHDNPYYNWRRRGNPAQLVGFTESEH